ncbi:ATP-binding protein [Clostridium sp. SYSU_GA19001]|uniref:ATP-binding protein n=1 Tax=Clostridium caldaquaticum TaxID=2940653 RepID=UPI002077999A|nr:ATP-binding protein [Clostridium caldaquaticum]MCM8712015.1 ATP-binding protein [Clostridium caldaquaticum]
MDKNNKFFPSLRQVFFKLVLFRLFLPLVLVGLITIAIVSYLFGRNFINKEYQTLQAVSQIVENHLDHGSKILNAVALAAETTNKENLSTFMKSTLQAYKYFDTLYYLDEKYKIKLILPFDPRYSGLDMSNLPDIKIKGENISHPFISLRTGEPTVYLISPISQGAYIVGELNLSLLQDEITNLTNNSISNFIFIMDQTGTLLAHPDSNLVKEQVNMSNLKIFHKTQKEENNAIYMYEGSRFFGTAVKVKRTGWIVVAQIPISVFYNSYSWILGLAFFASFIILLTLMLNLRKQLQKYVIAPLEQLSRETNALTFGNFSNNNFLLSVPATFAELNKLSTDFQFMSNSLKARETALRESEERYRGLYNRVPIGLFRATLSGKIVDFNPTVMDILGYTDNEELLNTNINNFIYSSLINNELELVNMKDVCELTDFELQIKRNDGTIIWVQVNCRIVYNNKEQQQYLEGSIQDITLRKYTETMIKEQQKLLLKAEQQQRETLEKALVMKDEFISLISHEFRTPLNVIYSAIQLIECVYIYQLPDRVKELISNIKQNTFRQLRLANNLLDITRINSGQINIHTRNIDIVLLTNAITESVRVYAAQKNIKISFNTNVEKKIISIDDEKYERIILNLLSNAIKFTENGGKITIEFNVIKKSNKVQIKVTDTGIGIPKDKHALIFERFGQVDNNLSRQAEGIGIGLSLVKLLVNILDGTIELESELGMGSTFIVELPAKKAAEDSILEPCFDIDDRLLRNIKVEFSDIYF